MRNDKFQVGISEKLAISVILTIIKQNESFAKIPSEALRNPKALIIKDFRFFAMLRIT
jgi:hypothetical protein